VTAAIAQTNRDLGADSVALLNSMLGSIKLLGFERSAWPKVGEARCRIL
jgi:hypothetical protein